jgi:hypothetical protein
MAMSVLEGIIYFDEMKYLSHRALVLLTLGLIMAIVGAVSMGWVFVACRSPLLPLVYLGFILHDADCLDTLTNRN